MKPQAKAPLAERLGRAVKATFRSEPISVEVQGKVLHCGVCGHDEFWKDQGQLNRSWSTLLQLDWTDRTGTCYVCAQCGYIHWFLTG